MEVGPTFFLKRGHPHFHYEEQKYQQFIQQRWSGGGGRRERGYRYKFKAGWIWLDFQVSYHPTTDRPGPRLPRKRPRVEFLTDQFNMGVLDKRTKRSECSQRFHASSVEVSSSSKWERGGPISSGGRCCWTSTLLAQERRSFTPSMVLFCISEP